MYEDQAEPQAQVDLEHADAQPSLDELPSFGSECAKTRKITMESLLNSKLNTFILILKHRRFCKRDWFSMKLSILHSKCWHIFEMNTFALKLNFCPKGPSEKRQRRMLRIIFSSKISQKLKNFCLEASGTILRIFYIRRK